MEESFLNRNNKRSLILAGGGVRLAYHAGVLMALEEAGLSFSHVDGTSGGIFGTAMLASGIMPKEAAVKWRNLDLKGFMSIMPVKDYIQPNDLPALGSADGIRKKIFPSLGIDPVKINANTRFEATFNVCNFSKKTVESVSQKNIIEDHLIAGMSLPIFMPGIKIGPDWYTDAVWIKDANMTGAINLGTEEIWLIWCIGNTHEYLNGSFNQYVHMIEISASGGVFAEIEWLRNVNATRVEKGQKAIDLHIIKPEYPLPLDPDFMFNKINADTLINMGYADTRQYLANSKPFADDEPAYQSTAMKTFDATLHFRQQFKGTSIINGQEHPVTIQLSFYIREIAGSYVFQLFSSISVNQSDFISGYDNSIIITGKGSIEGQFRFDMDGISHNVQVKMKLHSVIDLLFGMDNKTAMVTIDTGPGSWLVQPALNRIKNAFYLNVNTAGSWFGKLKIKHRLLSQLFS